MNPFDTLVIDEPPLTISPDALVARGRRTVRRRRAATVASGVGLAVGGVAVAVPALSSDPTPTTVRVGDPTPKADPWTESEQRRIPEVVRLLNKNAGEHGHQLIGLHVLPRFRDSTVTIDMNVDSKSTIIGWGIPSHGLTACDVYEGLGPCRAKTLPDGASVFVGSVDDHGRTTNLVRIFRPDGTELQLRSLDILQPVDSTEGTPAPNGKPAYTLDQLDQVAVAVNDELDQP